MVLRRKWRVNLLGQEGRKTTQPVPRVATPAPRGSKIPARTDHVQTSDRPPPKDVATTVPPAWLAIALGHTDSPAYCRSLVLEDGGELG